MRGISLVSGASRRKWSGLLALLRSENTARTRKNCNNVLRMTPSRLRQNIEASTNDIATCFSRITKIAAMVVGLTDGEAWLRLGGWRKSASHWGCMRKLTYEMSHA